MGRAAWSRPQLIVLRHGAAEEHVLTVCKTEIEWPEAGAESGYSACYMWEDCYPVCSVPAMS